MKKILRLSESELTDLIKTLVKESKRNKRNRVNEQLEYAYNPEALDTGTAIVTMVGTTLALLGVAGWDYIRDFYNELRTTKGKEKEAMELGKIIAEYEENEMNSHEEVDSEIEVDDIEAPEIEEPREPMAESIRRRTRRY